MLPNHEGTLLEGVDGRPTFMRASASLVVGVEVHSPSLSRPTSHDVPNGSAKSCPKQKASLCLNRGFDKARGVHNPRIRFEGDEISARMDEAYNQHSQHTRRKNRSAASLNHLSLAPLTTRLPLADDENLSEALAAVSPYSTSYLQGRSAPTTPHLLSRSPTRSHSGDRKSPSTPAPYLPKSRSATHLGSGHGVSSNTARQRRQRRDELRALSAADRNDSDWLLRAGALISSETRESKGQAWLATRAGSTRLVGLRDANEDVFERTAARERELTSRSASRNASRRGSLTAEDGLVASSPGSRLGSRSHSRVFGRAQTLATPLERRSADGYFPQVVDVDDIPGPDFVNLNRELEAIEQDTTVEDEDHVRRLVKREKDSVGGWLGNVIGWPLFSVQENDEEEQSDGGVGEQFGGEPEEDRGGPSRRHSSLRRFEGVINLPDEDRIPPPKADEGGWQDAAWLLSVASRVIL